MWGNLNIEERFGTLKGTGEKKPAMRGHWLWRNEKNILYVSACSQ